MSAVVTLAELRISFTGETSGADKANLKVRQDLLKTAATAEDAAESMLHLASAIATAGGAYEGASVQGATWTRVAVDTSKSAQVVAASFAEATKQAIGVESALDIATVAARSASTSFGAAGTSATGMSVEIAGLRTEVQGLGRTFGSAAATNYATKLDAGATAATTMETRVATLTAQVTALNSQLAQTKATGFPNVPSSVGGGGRGAAGSGGFDGKASRFIGTVGSDLTKYVTVPVLAAGAAAVAMDNAFDQALHNVDTVAKLSSGELIELRKNVLALTNDPNIKQGPKELADALVDIYSSQFKGKEALDVLRVSAIGATGGLTTTLEASKLLTSTLRSGIGGVTSAQQAMDVLFKEVDLGKNTFSELTGSFGRVLAASKGTGVTLQEVSAAYAALTIRGFTAAQATTAITNLLLHVSNPSKQAKEAMHALGIEYGFAAIQSKGLGGWLQDVVNKTGGNKQALQAILPEQRALLGAISLTSDGLRLYNGDLAQMKRAHDGIGSSTDAASRAMQGQADQADKMRQEVSKAALALGEDLLPIERDAIKVVSDLTHWFSSLDDETRQTYERWALAAAAYGPYLKGLVGIANGIRAIVGLREAYVATQAAQQAANLGTAATATTATVAATGLGTAVTALIGLAAAPIVFTIGWQVGSAIHGKMDEAAQGAGYDNSGDWLFHKLPNFNGGGGSTGDQRDAEAGRPYLVPDFYKRRATDLAKARAQRRLDGAFGGLRDTLQQENEQDAARKRVQAAVDEARQRAAAYARAGGIASGLGGGRGRRGRQGGQSQEDREADQLLQSLRDRVGNLATAYKLLGNESEAASLKQEILGGEFASSAQRAKQLAGVMDELRKRGKLDFAANQLFGRGFDSLSPTAKLKAEALALQLVTDKRKTATEAAKAQAEATKQVLQSAQQAANQATREALAASADNDEDRLSYLAYGVRAKDLEKVIGANAGKVREALAQQAKGEKDSLAKNYTVDKDLFDDGASSAAENRARRAEAILEATRKSAENYRDIMLRLSERKGEGEAVVSLAARRRQSIQEAINDLKASGNVFVDAYRSVQIGNAAGEAFDAAPVRAYRDAMRQLTRELGDVRGQTEAARLAAIRFDADGIERMSEASAKAVLDMEKLVEKERAFHEQTRQAGESVGKAFADGMNEGVDHGVKAGIGALMRSLNQQIRESVIGSAAKGVGAWVTRSLNRNDPNKAAIDALGGGKSTPVSANTAAVGRQTTATRQLTGMIKSLIESMGGSVPSDDAATSLGLPGLSSGIVAGESNGIPNWLNGMFGVGVQAIPGGSILGGLFGKHFAKGGHVVPGDRGTWQENKDGSGGEGFIASREGDIMPRDVVAGMARDMAIGRGGDASTTTTHTYLTIAPQIHVPGPIDRRSEAAIHSAVLGAAQNAQEMLR